jgi:predicted transglutaminase-like cysteine proteinase
LQQQNVLVKADMKKNSFWNQHLKDNFWIGAAVGLTVSGVILTKEIMTDIAARENGWQGTPDAEVVPSAKEAYQKWLALIEPLRNLPLEQKARQVDAKVNALMTYIDDNDLYGVTDYWAQAALSVYHRKGDCEDYAILKYETLRYLGVSDDVCGVLYVDAKDAKGNPAGHAVTMVDLSREKGYLSFLLLDNEAVPIDLKDIAKRNYVPRHVYNRSTAHPYPAP